MNSIKHASINLNVRGIETSATLSLNELSRHLQNEGERIYRLGLGQSPFPVPEPVVKALKDSAHEKDYLPAKGLPSLRDAVADFLCRREGVEANPNHILIGPGSKELMFLLQLVFYGELIVPTPCWVSYIPQARILGRRVSLIHTRFEDRWRLTAERLSAFCRAQRDRFRPRLLILNYPGNPEGCTYTADELKELADVAREYEIIVLSDEIYGQLHHEGRHISLAQYYPNGTIISSGISKWCGAGGWRLGTFTFPQELEWLMEIMTSVASETYSCVCAPVQYAAVRAFRGGIEIELYLWHARRILADLGQRCFEILKSNEILVHPPEGAFYLFPDLSPLSRRLAKKSIHDSPTLCEQLLDDTGVAVLPGAAFGRNPRELSFRIAYVDFDGSKAMAASEKVPPNQPLPEGFAKKWCGNVLTAVERIVEWASG